VIKLLFQHKLGAVSIGAVLAWDLFLLAKILFG
jgi:hypothetical protein